MACAARNHILMVLNRDEHRGTVPVHSAMGLRAFGASSLDPDFTTGTGTLKE
jgi:hypothetical protein